MKTEYLIQVTPTNMNPHNTSHRSHRAFWSHWNRPLALIAWTTFVISFFLPSYGDGLGYQCATMHGFFWSGVLEGNWASIHYELLTLPNLLMLASPFLLIRFGGGRALSWLRYSTFAATALVWSFLILLLANGAGGELKVGAFAWATSFVVLWVSSVLQGKVVGEAGELKQAALCI